MHRLARWIRPWATTEGADTIDSLVMDPRDRTANLGSFAAAAVAWVLVGFVVTTRDPVADPAAGFLGAALIGLAVALTLVPLLWLTVYGRHHQIAYRGDWVRAVRRATWVGIVVAVLIILRVQGLLELPIALFIVALALVAEATLSADR
jgi:cobalamin synthase